MRIKAISILVFLAATFVCAGLKLLEVCEKSDLLFSESSICVNSSYDSLAEFFILLGIGCFFSVFGVLAYSKKQRKFSLLNSDDETQNRRLNK